MNNPQRRLNRITPQGPAHLYKTYAIRSPLSTHFRRVQCAEFQCEAFQNGWQLRVQDLTPELLHTAKNSGRRYTELAVTEGETYLVFEPGQPCFRESTHVVPLDRPEFYFTGRGDHRMFSTRKAVRLGSEDWQDSLANHLDKLRRDIEKG